MFFCVNSLLRFMVFAGELGTKGKDEEASSNEVKTESYHLVS